MASVYDLKPRFQQLLRPSIIVLSRAGVTPNMVTGIALAGSIIVGIAVSQGGRHSILLLLLPLWLFVRMALNAIDGMMARELNMKSALGAVLNETGDAISDLGLYLPLAFVNQRALWAVVAFSIGAVMTEFCGLLGSALGASRRYDGPMGKSDRAFVVGALGLATYLFPGIVGAWIWIFSGAAVLTLVTCLNRLRSGLKELNRL
jgi:phosphatidylglycerophosphate synthase